MKKITILLPIHIVDDKNRNFIKSALVSTRNMFDYKSADISKKLKAALIIVCPKDFKEEVSNLMDESGISGTVVTNNGNTDFCSQVNLGVSKIKTDYFSILEMDDRYNEKWLDMAIPYMEDKDEETSVFMPLIEAYDASEGYKEDFNVIQYINEIALSNSFAANELELGKLGVDELKSYYNFNLTGAIINTEKFKECGMFKPSIKLSFTIEMLLRMADNKCGIKVLPKVGYYKAIGREESLSAQYSKEIDYDEADFWVKKAIECYKNKEDENITYVKEDKVEDSDTSDGDILLNKE